MRMPASILAVMAATLLVSQVRPQEGVKKVEELRKERIAVLKNLTDALEALYKSSNATFDEVLEARHLLIDAELEAAKTDAERVELYKNLVVVLKAYESWADVQHKTARATVASVLKAKAKRLEAEIHLEQAKMKVAKGGK
jgi:hypothetical protein